MTSSTTLFSQSENVGIGTISPDNSAILELDVSTTSSKMGLLIPRMTSAERNGIASSAKGLIVYDTSLDLFYFNKGTAATPNWVPLIGGLVDLTSDVTGILPVANGGIGTSSITGMVQGNGTSALTGITAAADQVTYWSDANTIAGDASFIWNSTTKTLDITGSLEASESVSTPIYQYQPLAAQPSTPSDGMTYFNSALNELQIYKNGAWQNIGSGGGTDFWTQSGTDLYTNQSSWSLYWQDGSVSNSQTTAWGGGTASAYRATAWGTGNTASANLTTAFGDNNTASGNASTAWGSGNNATQNLSTVWGQATTASNELSTAWGLTTTASGRLSTALGSNTIAYSGMEFTIGQYNAQYAPSNTSGWSAADKLFVAGIGTGASDQKDGFVIYKSGATDIFGNTSIKSNTNGTANQLRFYEDPANGTNYSSFEAPAQDSDINYTLPDTIPEDGKLLRTNASGDLSWTAFSSVGGSFVDVNVTTGDYTATEDDFLMVITQSGSTITLPTAASSEGKVYYIVLAPGGNNFDGFIAVANGSGDDIAARAAVTNIELSYGNGLGVFSGALLASDGNSRWYIIASRRVDN